MLLSFRKRLEGVFIGFSVKAGDLRIVDLTLEADHDPTLQYGSRFQFRRQFSRFFFSLATSCNARALSCKGS